jgi:hypothetical protein
LIGLESETTVKSLLETLPEIASVNGSEGWVSRPRQAWPRLSPAVDDLKTLTPGMAAVIRLRGGVPVEWQRPITPIHGLVNLFAGENWVAWAGRDGWAITDVVRGIGKSLIRVEAGGLEYSPLDPATAEVWSRVTTGDALRVTVSRDLRWLQPTGTMPNLLFPGGASQQVQEEIRTDMIDVLDFFAFEYGIEADASSLDVYIPTDAEAFFFELSGRETHYSSSFVRNWFDRHDGWGGDSVFVKQSLWQEEDPNPPYGRAQQVLAHEYVHAIQYDLRGNGGGEGANWLLEGMAHFAERKYAVARSDLTWSQVLEHHISLIASETPLLRSAESPNGQWQYYLGLLAVAQLAQHTSAEALADFYRLLHPSGIGPSYRWISSLSWHDAFWETFGLTTDEFYGEFGEWQVSVSDDSPVSRRSNGRLLAGQLVRAGGMPIAGAWITASPVEGDATVGWATRGSTYEDGNFELFVPQGASIRLQIKLADSRPCSVYYADGGITNDLEGAELVSVGTGNSTKVNIVAPADICRHRIVGRVVDSRGGSLPGLRVSASGNDAWLSTSTDAEGRFALVVPGSGEYRVGVDLREGCSAYWGEEGIHISRSDAERVVIGGADSGELVLQILDSHCARQLRGVALDTNGSPLADQQVRVHYESGDWGASGQTDVDGRFEIITPDAASYRLSIVLDGCSVYYQSSGATTDWDEATLIRVSDVDVTGLRLQLEAGMCGVKISGWLLDDEGVGLADTWVYASSDDAHASAQTGEDGTFSITLPTLGSYRVGTWIDGCNVHYRRGRATGSYRQAAQIPVSDSDVTGVTFQLARGMCAHRISGELLNADGTPRSGQWVSANGDAGSGGATTATDGSFSFAVPGNGAYPLSVYIDGCSIAHSSRGPTKNWNDARQITITNADATGIEFRLPENPATFCSARHEEVSKSAEVEPEEEEAIGAEVGPGSGSVAKIRGRLLDADGNGVAEIWIWIAPEGGGRTVRVRTTADGSFSFTVPSEGSWNLFTQIDGCWVNYNRGERISISNADVTGIEFRLPEDPASFCN